MKRRIGRVLAPDGRVVALATSLGRHLPTPIRRPLGRVKRRFLGGSSRRSVPRTPATPPESRVNADGRTTPGPPPAKSRLETRREFIFRTADRGARVLEIGPAHNPILPKRGGFNTRNVDYLDRAGLVHKYREFKQYSPDDIEEVDYVLPAGASMADVIPDRFDVVLASHVLEHTISLIDFINDCTRLLAPGGVLSLVVPDHRYCFDRFRERSSIGRVIDVSMNPPKFHTVGTLTEFTLNAVKLRGATSWKPGHQGTYALIHDLDQAQANARRAQDGNEYIDVHNWIFSPNHLRLLLEDLHSLGYITVREAAFQDTIGHEFFLNLQVGAAGPGISRTELVVLADAEQTSMDQPEFEPQAPADASDATAAGSGAGA